MSEEAFIYEAIRTPRGKQRNGSLNEVKPLNLVVGLVDELRRRNPDLDETLISDMILGVVSPVGDQGGDIARTAVLAAGLPETTGGVQLNRFCASGLEAVNTAAQKVRSGWDDLVLAGGVESMSRVPMGSDGGAWATDPETNYQIGFVPQGIGADLIATTEGFSREDVDRYALRSQEKAAAAWSGGYFAKSVVPVRDQNGLVLDCSNRFFSSPQNIIFPGVAQVMGDGWETARRRDDENDWVLLRLAGPGRVRLAEIDTSYFVGNSPGAATLTGFSPSGDRVELLPRTHLLPDTRHRFLVDVDDVVEQARLDIYPDGGLSRLRLFGGLA